jgi:hypothetical protein
MSPFAMRILIRLAILAVVLSAAGGIRACSP